MSWSPDYITESQFRSYAGIGTAQGTAEIAFAIGAASRAIDEYTGRQFGLMGSAVPRYYTAFKVDALQAIVIDDLMTTTGLTVEINSSPGGAYDTALTLNTDYYLGPLNAAADGRPWTALITRDASLLLWDGGVQVTAKWGWSEVPAQVEQACLVQALRFWKRKEAPFGVAGSPQQGSELRLLNRLDPDVQMLVDPLRRVWGVK